MRTLRSLARRIRHMPGLEGAEQVWRFLRQPYHRMLESGGRGVRVVVGGHAEVWLPAEFVGTDWERYEPGAVAHYVEWVRRHPGSIVLDIGSSIGILSAVALFADPTAEVIAFESDLNSLAASQRLCTYASGRRLHAVHGFVGEAATESVTLATAIELTEQVLATQAGRGERRYICLSDVGVGHIPCRRLDDLLANKQFEGRPMLLKCDVEGAELLVLSGARALLRRVRPQLLVSVHPHALPEYGRTKEDVQRFLQGSGYVVQCIAIDHEEHWWCTPVREGGE